MNATKIKVIGDHDERTIEQLKRCAERAEAAVLCADGHVGYSQPIGGAIAYEGFISPSGVGYDIGCGNKAVRTNLRVEDVRSSIASIMDEVFRRISFGVGRINDEPVDHPVFDEIRDAEFTPQRKLLDMATKQLGTVGSGNHYVDIFAGEDGFVWVGVHFGSRGFGHKTASGFLALAQGLEFDARAHEGEMDAEPTLLPTASLFGQSYVSAMQLAGKYAYAGRDVVVDKVLEILGAKSTYEVHNHHNFAWEEEHNGKKLWVVRKGCTPAFPGQVGFVGATMGGTSVILEGVESDDAKESLYSTVHGAGRVLSRTQAAGKKKWVRGEDGIKRPTIVRPGIVDWDNVKRVLKTDGIELRGGGADEAPEAYKHLDEVLFYHRDSIKIKERLTPMGVAMAGAETYDPYKD